MNFLEKISLIKAKLSNAGFQYLANEITELQLSGGTGGEVLYMVCGKLMEIKKSTEEAFDFIESESIELIDYANSLGLFPTWPSRI